MLDESVGRSEWTPLKMEHYKSIIEMHLAVTFAVLKKYSYLHQYYHYIDCTSGPGDYRGEFGIEHGSPVIFINAVEMRGLPYRADLFEENPSSMLRLKKSVPEANCGTIDFHPHPYQQGLMDLVKEEDRAQHGILYCDPSNGIPDFESEIMEEFVAKRPKMELLFSLAATCIKRTQKYTNRTLLDYVQCIDKKNWLIRKPFRGDKHQWTFLLGSNSDLFKRYKKIDFYPLGSSEADRFFEKLNLTTRQRQEKRQPRLFDLPGEDEHGTEFED